jgi:hypothetical protein
MRIEDEGDLVRLSQMVARISNKEQGMMKEEGKSLRITRQPQTTNYKP